MENNFDTVFECLRYYEEHLAPGTSRPFNPVVKGVTLAFYVYRLTSPFIVTKTNVKSLFSLCVAEDASTNVIICEHLIIEKDVILTPPLRCRGLILFCSDCLQNNGTITMTSRGCKAAGQNIYLLKNDKTGVYEMVPATGAAGGPGFSCAQWGGASAGQNGANGVKRQTGGGGSGGGRNWLKSVWVGRGGYGTSYSGGVGSGSAQSDGSYGGNASSPNAPDDGGAGGIYSGSAGNASGHGVIILSGQGNPPNMNHYQYRISALNKRYGNGGTGGLIIIYANLFEDNGGIFSQGGDTITCDTNRGDYSISSGGATGGGSINLFYAQLIKLGVYSAAGGRRTAGGAVNYPGGLGGDGTVTHYEDMMLFAYKMDRRNTNIYKDPYYQEAFDYDKLF